MPLFAAYIAEAERVRKVDAEEELAKKALEAKSEEALGLVALMKKVDKENQPPIYYSGGLRLLAKTLNNGEHFNEHFYNVVQPFLVWCVYMDRFVTMGFSMWVFYAGSGYYRLLF